MKITNCPKCNAKLDKNYKGIGKGCQWCQPKCEYCGEELKDFQMYHLPNCKAFQRILKEKSGAPKDIEIIIKHTRRKTK